MFLAINEVMYGGSSILEDLFQRGQHHLVDIDARRAGMHKQHGTGHLIAPKAIAFFVRMQDSKSGVGFASLTTASSPSTHNRPA